MHVTSPLFRLYSALLCTLEIVSKQLHGYKQENKSVMWTSSNKII